MVSVTKRISQVKQPRGGYISPKEFEKIILSDNAELNPNENLHTSLVGLAVDYLTRFVTKTTLEEAFSASLKGSYICKEIEYAKKLLDGIHGLDDKSIINACKLSGYDVCFRAGMIGYKPVQTIEPDMDTIFNIRVMVNRSVSFWKEYGPIVKSGFTFEGGYTDIVASGDGDYLTKDTLWDFKVSKYPPKSQHTLQLLMYYIMGKHSIHKEFDDIQRLGIFNPRLNIVYLLEMSKVNSGILDEISTMIIGYSNDENTVRQEEKKSVQANTEDWLMKDLVARYGVSRSKISDSFLSRGLPYSRVGREYHFIPEQVKEWEVSQRYIPYGKNRRIVLPAYKTYREALISEYKKAKRVKDKERIKKIKSEMKFHGISYSSGYGSLIFFVALIAVLFILIIGCFFLEKQYK